MEEKSADDEVMEANAMLPLAIPSPVPWSSGSSVVMSTGWLGNIIEEMWKGHDIPSLKLTFPPLKLDGWNTILSYWGGLFSGAFAVGFREGIHDLQLKIVEVMVMCGSLSIHDKLLEQ